MSETMCENNYDREPLRVPHCSDWKYTTCFSMDTQVPQPEYSPWKHFSPLLGSRDLTSGLCGKGFSAELSCQSRLAGIFIDSWGGKMKEKFIISIPKEDNKNENTSEVVWDAIFSLTF